MVEDIFMPPTLKKVGGHIATGLSIRSLVHLFVCLFFKMNIKSLIP